ncbi:MAG: DUF4157 domain-containing protein [Bacteroidia bacterium]|nr:DUF4157 domain-containing protein [Bacteroidia bacterium]
MASWSIRRKPVRRRTGQPAWAHAGEQQAAFFGPAPAIQPKLAIGTPGDAYEREADAVAERVVSGGTASPALSTSTGLGAPMQRMCPECEQEQKVQRMAEEEEPVQAQAEEEEMVQSQAEEEEPVQAQAEEEEMVQSQAEEEEPVQSQAEEEEMVQGKAQGSAPQHFASRLQARQGSGQPLPAPIRAQMEGGIGADFSGVRIHTDGEAQQMSQSIRAHAFTRGRDIYFNAGQYQPQSSAGQRLLAHELTHVVQQGGGEERVQTYRDKSAFNFGTLDDMHLKEDSFNKKKDKQTKPWIEKIRVKFLYKLPDKNGIETWFGIAKIEYFNNLKALSSFLIPVAGGSKALGLTDKGSFKVQRIEGIGYNSGLFTDPSVVKDPKDPRKRYSQDPQMANMSYAIFYNKGEALHAGPLDESSHGCVHVDWGSFDTIKQLNYHSVVGETTVEVAYP